MIVKHCPRPTYSVHQASPFNHRMPRYAMFEVYDHLPGRQADFVCRLSNYGDRVQNLCLRGIPLEDAQRLAPDMDVDPDV